MDFGARSRILILISIIFDRRLRWPYLFRMNSMSSSKSDIPVHTWNTEQAAYLPTTVRELWSHV